MLRSFISRHGWRASQSIRVQLTTCPSVDTSWALRHLNVRNQQFSTMEVSTPSSFADLPISKESSRSLAEVFKYEFMTEVQAETLPIILNGEDCLAKAKTGTGKTLAFLVPTIERIAARKDAPTQEISALIISPTRELAFQIAKEAESLTQFHSNINVVSFVGGNPVKKDLKALRGSLQIVVATPGRLLAHLQENGLAERMSNLQTLIFDEADHVLDMGFRPDVERILRLLNPSAASRQTLLFSATVPKSVKDIAKIALRPKYSFIDTVGENTEQTHLHVKQEIMVSPHDQQFAALASVLERETTTKPFKGIIFFTTARLTAFFADLFRQGNPGYQIVDIHSRKSQVARQKASDAFRKADHAVLFSSDVSARGMDYPDVTFVLQVGLTERAQYIHRLGRTARAGREGKGTLLLAPYELRHMKEELKDMPLELVEVPPISADVQTVVKRGINAVPKTESLELSAQRAYSAWLGYYKGNLGKCGWKAPELVQSANLWAKSVGLKELPRIPKKTIERMGLKGVPGLVIDTSDSSPPSRGKGGDPRRGSGKPRNRNNNNNDRRQRRLS
jgi:ATP-dependent RNA helicase MSS116